MQKRRKGLYLVGALLAAVLLFGGGFLLGRQMHASNVTGAENQQAAGDRGNGDAENAGGAGNQQAAGDSGNGDAENAGGAGNQQAAGDTGNGDAENAGGAGNQQAAGDTGNGDAENVGEAGNQQVAGDTGNGETGDAGGAGNQQAAGDTGNGDAENVGGADNQQAAGDTGNGDAGNAGEAEDQQAAGDTENGETGDAGDADDQQAAGGMPFERFGALSVAGTQLVGADGEPVQLVGVSTHGIAWYPDYVNQEAFRHMRDEWGISAVRLAMYTAEYNGYCVSDEAQRARLRALIDEGIRAATELGLYVIIDWHILSDGNPKTHQAEAITFFGEMAKQYAGQANVIYELCNEPNGGTTWQTIREYACAVIPVIRAESPDALIIVGTPTWSQDVDAAAKNPITEYENILYALHFYANTHKEGLRAKVTTAYRAGLPMIVSEYGICDASGSGANNSAEADKWIALLDTYGISHIAWNLSNKNETCALLRTSCTKATGGWTAAELSEAGTWFVQMARTHADNGAWNHNETGGNQSGSGTNGSQSGSGTGGNQSGSGTGSGTNGSQSGSKAAVAASCVNSWSDGTSSYAQYMVTVTNGSTACADWTATLTFSGDCKLDQFWNAQAEASGNTVTLRPAAYNAAMAAGGTASDIGVIVYGAEGLTLTESAVTTTP